MHDDIKNDHVLAVRQINNKDQGVVILGIG
jgi:hypothetical protein